MLTGIRQLWGIFLAATWLVATNHCAFEIRWEKGNCSSPLHQESQESHHHGEPCQSQSIVAPTMGASLGTSSIDISKVLLVVPQWWSTLDYYNTLSTQLPRPPFLIRIILLSKYLIFSPNAPPIHI